MRMTNEDRVTTVGVYTLPRLLVRLVALRNRWRRPRPVWVLGFRCVVCPSGDGLRFPDGTVECDSCGASWPGVGR